MVALLNLIKYIIYLLLTNKDIINPNTKIGKQEKIDTFKNVKSLFPNCFEYFILKIEQQMKGSILKITEHESRDNHIFCV